ncbi:hypothetical protein L596_018693 [Steinernema carpocapsae]|uniref:Uncharacterized protein n=1 Tax=Steinernema carpocapsae TaxID=34508 RepID=A0A4U5N6I1_STECR|nr:hypothetical protein L596_018693 [Steinernema carpocapsae]
MLLEREQVQTEVFEVGRLRRLASLFFASLAPPASGEAGRTSSFLGPRLLVFPPSGLLLTLPGYCRCRGRRFVSLSDEFFAATRSRSLRSIKILRVSDGDVFYSRASGSHLRYCSTHRRNRVLLC